MTGNKRMRLAAALSSSEPLRGWQLPPEACDQDILRPQHTALLAFSADPGRALESNSQVGNGSAITRSLQGHFSWSSRMVR
jgi:hypothetical protein